MKHKYFYDSIEVKKITLNKYPDYIDGQLTEPNENPVIFEYNYTRGSSYKVPRIIPGELQKAYVQDILLATLASLGVTIALEGVAIIVYAWNGTQVVVQGESELFRVFMNDITGLLAEGGAAQIALAAKLATAFASKIGAIAPTVLAITGLAFLTYISQAMRTELMNPYNSFYELGRQGKNKVDTEKDEKGNYKWKGYKMTMKLRYNMTMIYVVDRQFEYDTHGRYIETYASNPPLLFGTNQFARHFEIIEPLHIEYIPE